MTRPRTIASTLAVSAVLAMAAGPAGAQTVVTVWTEATDPGPAATMAAEFNALQDEIEVDVRQLAFADLVSQAMRAYATGTAPDIMAVDNPEHVLFASRGAFLDLTDLMARSEIIDPDLFYDGPRASLSWDGGIYGMPRGSNTIALYYNKDLFRAAGLDPEDPPSTWDELYAAAEALTDPEAGQFGLAFSAIGTEEGTFQFLPWLQMAGAGIDSLDSEGAVQALAFWQRILDDGLASRDTLIRGQWDSTATFNTGQAAMAISGPWELPRMSADADFDWGVTLMPTREEGGPRASALGDFNYAIFSTSEHPEAAFAFLEYYFSQSHRVWNEFGRLPPRRDADVSDANWPDAFETFATQLRTARVRGPHPDWPQISKAIQDAIQSALTGQATAEEALTLAAEQVAPILAD